jgi:branched-subunit amino acid aminotransferase/4-amino-4-deoxychorismate lyase
MQTLFNLDGREESHTLALGWQWAYGCFETFLWRNRGTLGFEWHIGRLLYGCDQLGLAAPYKNEELQARIRETFSHLPNELFRVRIEAVLDDPSFLSGGKPPFRVRLGGRIARWPGELGRQDFSVKVLDDSSADLLLPSPGYKPLDYAARLRTKNGLQRRGIQEGIVCTPEGFSVSCLTGNFFVLTKKDRWVTPSLQFGALTGVTRHIVMHLLPDTHAAEGKLHLEDLAKARSGFVCNSGIGVQPISRLFVGQRNWVDLDQRPALEVAQAYESLWHQEQAAD